MTRRIAVRDEYRGFEDERLLNQILGRLREEFLFLQLGDFEIEVHEQDHGPILQRLASLKQQLSKS